MAVKTVRAILLFLITILSACQAQDSFKNDYKVIGFYDGIARTIALNLDCTSNPNKNKAKKDYIDELNFIFALKLLSYST